MLTDDYMWRRFVKYNDLLRDFGANLEGCKGNKYITTTHVINSAIVKLSKLTKATNIYRGVGGGVLPESFWRPNTQGVKGGIESAFMSTTFERAVAMKYATSDTSKPALVFEMQMGMVDRGAELDWVSQYPHEKGERLRVCAFFCCASQPLKRHSDPLSLLLQSASLRRSRGSRCLEHAWRVRCS